MSRLSRIADRAGGAAFRIVPSLGPPIDFGKGEPLFTIHIRRGAGLEAITSLDGLRIAESYIAGDLDLEGDLLQALSYQEHLHDFHPGIYIWRRLQPLLVGRPRMNPTWIALHYDAQNAQLYAADAIWHTYTPGIYETDQEPLESAAERKLAAAYESLRLQPSQRLLEIGSGWGGMLRYSAQHGVRVTGLTLSRKQKQYVEQLIAAEQLPAEVHYQDFFTYKPTERFDAISMMGVIEDLSDYRAVMLALSGWVKPGGRVYLDFAAERQRFGTHSFVTKYVWPGTFRMVFMPEFVEAVRESPFELMRVDNDRRNYHLWARGMYERWQRMRAVIETEHGERLWRIFLLLYAGVAMTMDRRSHSVTAYRVLLEMPADTDNRFHTATRTAALDRFRGSLRAGREGLLKLWPAGKRKGAG